MKSLRGIIIEAERFGYFNKEDTQKIVDALKVVSVGKKYNHAYTIAFSLDTDHEPDDVTAQELLVALLNKVSNIIEEENIIECAGMPFDSFDN